MLTGYDRDAAAPRQRRGAPSERSEKLQHSGVAESVLLHPREVEELRDTLVVRAHELRVDRRVDGLVAHVLEAVAAEEVDLEREAEQPAEPQLAGVALEHLEEPMADAVAEPGVVDGEGAHLAEVLPHHVQGARADEPTVWCLRHAELLHRTVEVDPLLAEQDASLHERLHELDDPRHIARTCPAHGELAHPIIVWERR